MKIVIVGAGATGMTYAGLLANHADVTLLTRREEQAQEICEKGITVIRPDEEIHAQVQATTSGSILADADIVIAQTKCFDAHTVADIFAKYAGKDTALVSLHNGLGMVELYNDIIGKDRVIGGMTVIGASRKSDTVATFGSWVRAVIGEQDGSPSDRTTALCDVLSSSGFEAQVSHNIFKDIWSKLKLNVGQNALSALCNVGFHAMSQSEDAIAVAQKLLVEFALVARAEGFEYSDDELLPSLIANWQSGVNHYTSMHQDLAAGRKTEIDYINGAISRLGKAHSIPTPTNDTITHLVHLAELA